MKILIAVLFVVWVYILTVLHRAKLPFFKFLVGSVGMFLILMATLQPIITVPLQKGSSSVNRHYRGYDGNVLFLLPVFAYFR